MPPPAVAGTEDDGEAVGREVGAEGGGLGVGELDGRAAVERLEPDVEVAFAAV